MGFVLWRRRHSNHVFSDSYTYSGPSRSGTALPGNWWSTPGRCDHNHCRHLSVDIFSLSSHPVICASLSQSAIRIWWLRPPGRDGKYISKLISSWEDEPRNKVNGPTNTNWIIGSSNHSIIGVILRCFEWIWECDKSPWPVHDNTDSRGKYFSSVQTFLRI